MTIAPTDNKAIEAGAWTEAGIEITGIGRVIWPLRAAEIPDAMRSVYLYSMVVLSFPHLLTSLQTVSRVAPPPVSRDPPSPPVKVTCPRLNMQGGSNSPVFALTLLLSYDTMCTGAHHRIRVR